MELVGFDSSFVCVLFYISSDDATEEQLLQRLLPEMSCRRISLVYFSRFVMSLRGSLTISPTAYVRRFPDLSANVIMRASEDKITSVLSRNITCTVWFESLNKIACRVRTHFFTYTREV
jgi:hypothetical protein